MWSALVWDQARANDLWGRRGGWDGRGKRWDLLLPWRGPQLILLQRLRNAAGMRPPSLPSPSSGPSSSSFSSTFTATSSFSGWSGTSERSVFSFDRAPPSVTMLVRTGCEVNERRRKRQTRVGGDGILCECRPYGNRVRNALGTLYGVIYKWLEWSVYRSNSMFKFEPGQFQIS